MEVELQSILRTLQADNRRSGALFNDIADRAREKLEQIKRATDA